MSDSKREIDYLGLFLTLALLYLVALYLRTTEWTDDLDLVLIAVFSGFGLGFLLGKSKFDNSAAFWIGLSFTFIFITVVITIISNPGISLFNQLFSFIHRTGDSLNDFSTGNEITSPLLPLFVFTLIFWILSNFASFSYTRKRAYFPLFIIVLFFFILIEYFLPEKERSLWIPGLAAFIALVFYLYRTTQGLVEKSQRPGQEENGLRASLLRPMILVVAGVIVFASWSIPLAVRAATPGSPEEQRFNRFSYQFRNNFYRLTASLRGGSQAAAVGFGPSLPLGSQAANADTVIFTAEASRKLDAEERIYWRSKVYEIYHNGVWQEGEQKQVSLASGEVILQPTTSQGVEPMIFRVRANTPLGDYFIPGDLVSLNNPANLIYSPITDGGRDIIAIEPESTVLSGNGYRVTIKLKPQNGLNSTSEIGDIPEWVRNRYLQIPLSIQPGIQDLAEGMTTDAQSEFEKTLAITQTLRSTYQYLEEVKIPAVDQDRIEWFLYDGKSGFCNYFATAEVLLLRSIGIPARLAVGFSEGEVSADGLTYTVQERNRHAWPEVYFPEIGWVIFEPTPSLPEIQFLHEDYPSRSDLEGFVPDEELNSQVNLLESSLSEEKLPLITETNQITNQISNRKYDPFPVFLLVLTITVIAPTFAFAYSSRQAKTVWLTKLRALCTKMGVVNPKVLDQYIRRWQSAEIETVYNDIVRLGSLLFGVDPGNRTPSEVIQVLVEDCPEIGPDVQKMLLEYQLCVFGDRTSDDEMARKLGWKIQTKMILSKIASIFHHQRPGKRAD